MLSCTTFLGLAALATVATSTAVEDGCSALLANYPDRTFFPGSERYKYENECRYQPEKHSLYRTK